MFLKLKLKGSRHASKLIGLLLFSLAVLYYVISAQGKEDFIPVTMSIDGEYYPSSLLLQCKLESFKGIKQNDFKEDGDLVKKDFKKLLQNIKTNDVEGFRAQGKDFHNKEYDSKRIQKADRNLSVFNQLMRIYEEKGQGVKIYKHILLGNNGIFIFGSDRDKGKAKVFPGRRSFYYEKLPSGKIRWNCFEDTLDPLSAIITDSFEEAADNPTRYEQTAITSSNSRFKILIPGTKGKSPAYLRFNGKTYDVDVMNEEVQKDDDVLRFYQKAYQAWRDVSSVEFAKFYTSKSKTQILKTIKKNPNSFENSRHSSTLKRQVLFILDAHPFYVLFAKVGNRGALSHEYIVVDPGDGTFKLTNLGRVDLTSQYFLSDDFYSVLNTVDSKLFPMKKTSNNND